MKLRSPWNSGPSPSTIFYLLCAYGFLLSPLYGQVLTNGSLDGIRGSYSAPVEWTICSGSPDQQVISGAGGGIFGIAQTPAHGSGYVGMVATEDGYEETIGQATGLYSGTTYSGSIMLMRAAQHPKWDGHGRLQIWGGTACGNLRELLWTSGLVTNTDDWKAYPITFSPQENHPYIIFRNALEQGSGSMDYMLVDHVQLSASVLPIELISFTATARDGEVDLNWETNENQGGEIYEVEWSRDAQRFAPVDAMKALQGMTRFSLTHQHPLPGRNFYRLRSTDSDGTVTFSEIRQVTTVQQDLLQLWPNPASAAVHLSLSLEESATVAIDIFDASGQRIHTRQLDAKTGVHDIRLDLSDHLPSGVYHVKVRAGAAVAFERLVVQH